MTSSARAGIAVAIDGPSGSGKSSVSRQVAERLGLSYLDTGAMYRAVAWWCDHRAIDLTDAAAVAGAARALPLAPPLDPREQTIACDGVDITAAIRESRISRIVSAVATNLDVRAELVRRQREIIEAETAGGASGGRGIVAEGRDITTVVAPDAPVRLLLTASEESRLARRATDLHGTADAAAVAATRDEVVRRDAQDSTVTAFLTAADGVHTLDSSELSLEETVLAVLDLVARLTGVTAQGSATAAGGPGDVEPGDMEAR